MTIPPETIAQATEALAETVPLATEAIETVTEAAPDLVPYLEMLVEYQNYQTGFQLFFAVVVLAFFSYKFLRMFF